MAHHKILSQAGQSLADVYDVPGSIAGVESLESDEVHTVHEMGQTIFSERLSGRIELADTGAIAQSTAFSAQMAELPAVPMLRLMGILVEVSTIARVTTANVNCTDDVPGQGNEMVMWNWDGTNEDLVRIGRGGSISNRNIMRPMQEYAGRLPSFLVGGTQAEGTPTLNLRGTTSAFGAGTVTLTLWAYVAFPQLGGISSRGLPVPGW